MENRSVSDVGGTPGGLAEFLIGFIMVCIGGYLFANQVTVVGSYWNFYGANSFGITLLPLLFGVGILFFRGRSTVGWVLTVAGALFIFAGVIATHLFPTSHPLPHAGNVSCACWWPRTDSAFHPAARCEDQRVNSTAESAD